MRNESGNWTFFRAHGLVLFYLATNPTATLAKVGAAVGISERQVSRVISDLVRGRYLVLRKNGRRNLYRVNPDGPMRHPLLSGLSLRQFADVVSEYMSGIEQERDAAG